MSTSAFTPTVLTLPASAAGSGQGELNLITNPTATTDTTGWLAGAGATLGRGTGGGPLNPTVSTYFTTINTAGAESSTSGAYDVLTLPSGMQNRKLKVEFYFTSPAADTFKVSVYKGSTRVPLSTDSAGSTSLPQNTTGKFVAYFDTDSSGTWTVSITRTAGTGVTPFQFTNVVVGPGIQPQGAVVGLHTSYAAVAGTTIVGTTTNPTFGTTSKNLVNIERRGSWAKITWTYIQTTAGTAGSGAYYGFKMPSGLTIDTGLLGNSTAGIPGAGSCGYLSVNGLRNYTAAASDSQTIYFRDVAIGANWAPADSAHNFAQSSLTMELTIEVPVNEWAGSGTVQLAQNDVEYAYNSIEGTTIGTSYTNTAFVKYGPAGGTFPGITSKDTTSGYTSYIVQFQSPIQSGDKISLEYSSDNGVTWVDNTTSFEVQPFNQGTTYIGMDWAPNSSNSVLVRFGRGGREAPTTYAAAGSATWNTLAGISTRRWRVRKSSAGAAVGYGIVAKDQSGLLPAYNTNLDDATATRLGLKQYLHGTAYNGGIAPTVTCPQAGFAITRATFIPYQMQDGVWRVKFNIIATFSTATITSLVFTINGITFASIQQAVLSNFFNSLTNYAYTNVSASTINIVTASSSDNGVKLFGDVELASKPTWAYS